MSLWVPFIFLAGVVLGVWLAALLHGSKDADAYHDDFIDGARTVADEIEGAPAGNVLNINGKARRRTMTSSEQSFSSRTTADICLCGYPRHYHYDEDGASPVHKPGVGACMVFKPCVRFVAVGGKRL